MRLLYCCYAGGGEDAVPVAGPVSCSRCVSYHQKPCACYSETVQQTALIGFGDCYRPAV